MHGLVSKFYKTCLTNGYAGVDSQQFSTELRKHFDNVPSGMLDQIQLFLQLNDEQRLDILRYCGIPQLTRS